MIPLQTKAKYLLMAIRLSAKNAFLAQTSEVWRDRRPSIINPQGELCPPEENFRAGEPVTRSRKFIPLGFCARKFPQKF